MTPDSTERYRSGRMVVAEVVAKAKSYGMGRVLGGHEKRLLGGQKHSAGNKY